MLRALPLLLAVGTIAPLFAAWVVRVLTSDEPAVAIMRQARLFEFVMFGWALFNVALLATVAVACVIVWLMKGPAYVADGYDRLTGTGPL